MGSEKRAEGTWPLRMRGSVGYRKSYIGETKNGVTSQVRAAQSEVCTKPVIADYTLLVEAREVNPAPALGLGRDERLSRGFTIPCPVMIQIFIVHRLRPPATEIEFTTILQYSGPLAKPGDRSTVDVGYWIPVFAQRNAEGLTWTVGTAHSEDAAVGGAVGYITQ